MFETPLIFGRVAAHSQGCTCPERALAVYTQAATLYGLADLGATMQATLQELLIRQAYHRDRQGIRVQGVADGHTLPNSLDEVIRSYADAKLFAPKTTLRILSVADRAGVQFDDYREAIRVLRGLQDRITPAFAGLRNVDTLSASYTERSLALFGGTRVCLAKRSGVARALATADTLLAAIDLFGSEEGRLSPCQALQLAILAPKRQVALERLYAFVQVYGVARVDDVIALLHDNLLDGTIVEGVLGDPAMLERFPTYEEFGCLIDDWRKMKPRPKFRVFVQHHLDTKAPSPPDPPSAPLTLPSAFPKREIVPPPVSPAPVFLDVAPPPFDLSDLVSGNGDELDAEVVQTVFGVMASHRRLEYDKAWRTFAVAFPQSSRRKARIAAAVRFLKDHRIILQGRDDAYTFRSSGPYSPIGEQIMARHFASMVSPRRR